MKLKYILPVATIASVAAIATPLVTSCGPKENLGNTASWKHSEGEYTPMLKAKSPDLVKFSDADALTEAYRNDLSTTPLIYADDIVNYLSLCYDEDQFIFRSLEYTFTEVSSACEDAPSGEFSGRKMFRISFDLKIDATIKMTPVPGQTFVFEFENRSVSAKNMPVTLEFSTHNTGIYLKTNCTEMQYENDSQWSINMPEIRFESGGFVVGDNITYNKEKYASLDPQKEGLAVPSILQYMISFDTDMVSGNKGGSHYYMNAVKN